MMYWYRLPRCAQRVVVDRFFDRIRNKTEVSAEAKKFTFVYAQLLRCGEYDESTKTDWLELAFQAYIEAFRANLPVVNQLVKG